MSTLGLQTTEGKLANILNGQKRLATYLTANAGLQKSTNVYLRLVSSIEPTCRDAASSPKMKSFLSAFDSRPKVEKNDASWPSPNYR